MINYRIIETFDAANYPGFIVKKDEKREIIFLGGHNYRIQARLERDRKYIEIFSRVVLGALVTIVTFGVAYYLSERVRELFSKKERITLISEDVANNDLNTNLSSSQLGNLFNNSLSASKGSKTDAENEQKMDLEEIKKPEKIEEIGDIERESQRISEVLKNLPYWPHFDYQKDELISLCRLFNGNITTLNEFIEAYAVKKIDGENDDRERVSNLIKKLDNLNKVEKVNKIHEAWGLLARSLGIGINKYLFYIDKISVDAVDRFYNEFKKEFKNKRTSPKLISELDKLAAKTYEAYGLERWKFLIEQCVHYGVSSERMQLIINYFNHKDNKIILDEWEKKSLKLSENLPNFVYTKTIGKEKFEVSLLQNPFTTCILGEITDCCASLGLTYQVRCTGGPIGDLYPRLSLWNSNSGNYVVEKVGKDGIKKIVAFSFAYLSKDEKNNTVLVFNSWQYKNDIKHDNLKIIVNDCVDKILTQNVSSVVCGVNTFNFTNNENVKKHTLRFEGNTKCKSVQPTPEMIAFIEKWERKNCKEVRRWKPVYFERIFQSMDAYSQVFLGGCQLNPLPNENEIAVSVAVS